MTGTSTTPGQHTELPAPRLQPAPSRLDVTGNGVCLGASWQSLPPACVGVGIDVLDDALLAWCAPKVGRISTFAIANAAEFDAAEQDRLALTSWFIDQGFNPEQAALATCELLSRLGSAGWVRGMFCQGAAQAGIESSRG